MMYMCSARFETEEERLTFIKDSLDSAEAYEQEEERTTEVFDGEPDPISDNEDDGDKDDVQLIPTQEPVVGMVCQRASILGKRPRASIDEAESSSDDDLPPNTQTRVSGRARMPPKGHEEYVT
jgi:hypothetical protein